MSGEGAPAGKRSAGGLRLARPSRRLSFTSRLRGSLRRLADRVLAADAVWSAVFAVVVMMVLGAPWFGPDLGDLAAGQVAPRDVKTREDFLYPDRAETERLRAEARAAVPDIYAHDADRGKHLAAQLADVFRRGRESREQATRSGADPAGVVRTRLEEIAPEALEVLLAREFDPVLERELTAALERVMASKVVGNKALLERERAITLVSVPDAGRERFERFEEFVDLSEARSRLRHEVGRRLDLSRNAERALGELAAAFVDSNVYYDREATSRARQDAALAVPRSLRPVRPGTLLARKGQVLTEEDVEKIRAMQQASRPAGPAERWGLLLIAAMLAFFLYRYAHYHQRDFRKLRHLHSLMVLMLVSMLLLSDALLFLARRVADNLEQPFDRLDSYPYVVPLGAGAILVALLANGRIATVYAAFAALLFGAANGWSAHLMLWAMLVQCAGVYAISTYRSRTALLRAGLLVGGAGAIAAFAVETIQGEPHGLADSAYAAGLAFAGGAVGVGLLISFSLPLLERMFNVLTDIRLLELSNVNTPVLSELALKAPGSYNHSLVVGTLAEEAAKAIGANSLFCRVAAFYHDIGKMNKAEYFVENQRGVNPHDRLSPSMSALIIASHVKDGIRIAREAGLPEQIVDIIPQHHGTKLMTYFFEKAR
jgi:putative nucleotidyltransferase with HDIG domain